MKTIIFTESAVGKRNDDLFIDAPAAALAYIARGFLPIPLDGEKTKRVTRPGWPDERHTAEDAHRFAGRNVGLLLGPISGGLTDVDLDCAEAIRAAAVLLPKTNLVGGRKSARRAHHFFRCDPLPMSLENLTDPLNPKDEKGKMLELRTGWNANGSKGQQTMVAPSVHPDNGEMVFWEEFGEPAVIGAADLTKAVTKVAAAALLGRYWPKNSRHDASLALAGGLLRAWDGDEARVSQFVEAVVAAAEDEELRDRLNSVRDTVKDLATGKKATGWPKLAGYLGERGDAIVSKVREWLDIPPRTERSEESVVGAGRGARPLPPWVPFPVATLPPVLAEYVAAVAAACLCDPAYSALPVLTAVAAAVGTTHRVRIKASWLEPPVLWTVCIGPSGTTKTPPYRDVEDLAQDINDRLQTEYDAAVAAHEPEQDAAGEDADDGAAAPVLRDFIKSDTTIEALVGVLQDNPRGVLIGRDELAGWLHGFVRYARNGSTDLQHWLQLSNAGTVDYLRKTGDRRRVRVRGVAVSVTGTTQPGVIAAALTPELRLAGLFARLLPVLPPLRLRKWTEAEVPDAVRRAVADLLDRLFALTHDRADDGRLRPRLVRLTAAAKGRFTAFYDRNGAAMYEAECDDERAAMSKLEAYAARFALVFHCCRHPDGPDAHPISGEDMAAAIALTEWFTAESARVYQALGETADERVLRQRAERVARKATKFGGRLTVKQLQNSNSRRYRTSTEAEAELEALVTAGFGGWEEDARERKGGHRVRHYRPVPTSDPSDPCLVPDDGGKEGASDPPSDPCAGTNSDPPRTDDATAGPATDSGSGCEDVPGQWSEGSEVGNDRVAERTPSARASHPERGPGQESERGRFTPVTDPAGLPSVAASLGGADRVGLDTETTGLNPRDGRLRLLQLATPAGTFVVDCFAVDPAPLFGPMAGVELVGHNLAFELSFLMPLGFEPGRLFDTMLASQVLDAGDRTVKHALEIACERHLGETVDKAEQRSDWSGPLTADQLRYAARDAELPLRLRPVLVARLAEADLTATADLENRALPCVAWAGSRGVAADRSVWQTLAAAARAAAARLAAEMDALAPTPPGLFGSEPRNWNSTDEVRAAFHSVGVALESTDDDALAALAHPLADRLRSYRSAVKRAGTYGADWAATHIAPDGRVYPSWRQLSTVTGRMSCADPNLQQLPRDKRYRKCFLSPPGRVLVKADYSQIELRIAAALSGDAAMIAAYRQGADLHALTAAAILGKSVTEVMKEDRQLAKAVNFGLLFGGGAGMLVGYAKSNYGVTLTEAQARAYRRAFFRQWPGLKRWHARAGDTPADTRTRGGRRRKAVAKFTERTNTPVQGTAADGMKAALARLWDRRHEHPTAFPVLIVHDEIVVECDECDAEAVTGWLVRAMADGMGPLCDPVPVEVEATIAPTWGG